MKSLTSPPFLQKGDTVAVVALASKLDKNTLQSAIEKLEEWGLQVVIGSSVGATDFNFSGNDEIRQQDFQRVLDNPAVKAIFSARGGYGSSRIIDDIDFTHFIQSPKWVIGFSDITAVHGKLQNLGVQSIHGPMLKSFFWDNHSDELLRDVLFGKNIYYKCKSEEMNRTGEAIGLLTGGNLALLAHAIGTGSDVDFSGKILFIEDIGEYHYNIDRMMIQLKRAGKLSNLAGLIVGQFNDLRENVEPFGKAVNEIIADHVQEFTYPVAYNFPIGHTNDNWAVRCGELMQLSVTADEVILKSMAVNQNV